MWKIQESQNLLLGKKLATFGSVTGLLITLLSSKSTSGIYSIEIIKGYTNIITNNFKCSIIYIIVKIPMP